MSVSGYELSCTTIRSRSNKSVGDTIETKWTIIAKHVIAEPTPRTPTEAPRWGIYGYDVVPLREAAPVNSAPAAVSAPRLISVRRIVKGLDRR